MSPLVPDPWLRITPPGRCRRGTDRASQDRVVRSRWMPNEHARSGLAQRRSTSGAGLERGATARREAAISAAPRQQCPEIPQQLTQSRLPVSVEGHSVTRSRIEIDCLGQFRPKLCRWDILENQPAHPNRFQSPLHGGVVIGSGKA